MDQNKFQQIAEQAVSNSAVIAGHEKITTDDLIAKYPDGVTIIAFDFISRSSDDESDGDGYPVFNFAEDQTKYFNGGTISSKVATGWINAYAGDIAAASADLGASGGVKFKMGHKKTKTGKNITTFDPIA